MENNELNALLEKFKSGKIEQHDLERLKEVLDTSSGKKLFLHTSRLDYDTIRKSIDNYPAYKNHQKIQDRLNSSILKQSDSQPPRKLHLIYIGLAIAASLLIAGIFLYRKNEIKVNDIDWVTIQTSHGEQKIIRLEDDTEIKLNGNSYLSYSASKTADLRIVKLKGEAFFNVKKDSIRPFLILSKDFVTRVVGTSFNIDSEIDKSIEVKTGKVKVFQIHEDSYSKSLKQDLARFNGLLERLSEAQIDLSTGERAVLEGNKMKVKSFTNTNWYNNELVHLGEKVSTILMKAYRFYGDSIIVSPEIADARTTITFKDKNIEQVLSTIAEMNNAKLYKKSTHLWEIKKK